MAIVDIHDEDVKFRRAMAISLDTSPRLLAKLIDDEDPLTAAFAAVNPNTPEEAKEDVNFSGEYIYELWADEADPGCFDDDEWMYHLNSGCDPWEIKENAVILSNTHDDYEEPEWWKDTLDFLNHLDFDLSFEDFIETYRYDNYKNGIFEFDAYVDSDEAWEEALTKIYDAYREYGSAIEFKFAAVEALYPDLTFERVDADDPYGRGQHVTVFYNYSTLDEITQDKLQTWYFWDVYEARCKWLDIERLADASFSEVSNRDTWELFDDFGDYGDDWAFIEGPEYEAAVRNDRLLELLADELGYSVKECILG